VPAAFAQSGEAAGLVPHLAVYDLSLARAEERAGIASASGRMVIELEGSPCEGWTLNFRLVVQYGLTSGKGRLLDSRSNSWESAEGDILRYTKRQYVDSVLQEEALLTARLGAEGKPGSIAFTKPREETLPLPVGALFPVRHQIRLMEAARAGATRDRSVVYDGADEGRAYDAIAFIGPEQAPRELSGGLEGSGVETLGKLATWPVTISYYKHDGEGEETPSHQVSFLLFANGVSGDLTLDYGDFTLAGKLSRLDLKPQKACP
jgi:hypothetical protein